MELYVINGEPNARKCLAVAYHLGVNIEPIFVDIFRGDTKSEAYLKINPSGHVPALVDDDFALWESNAINKYMCSKCPGNTLYPPDSRIQADIDRWISWSLAHFNQRLDIVSFETVIKPNFYGQQPDEPIVAWGLNHLSNYADVLERHLEGRRYMVGDAISLADYEIVHIEIFKDDIPFDWLPYPNLNAYYDRMRATPHWAKTAARPEEIGRIPQGARAFAA